MSISKKYRVVTVGGTFDHLHKGHRAILKKAFAISQKVIIGITSDAMMQKSGKTNLSKGSPFNWGFDKRRRELEVFLRNKVYWDRAEIVKIEDKFGPLKVKSGKCKIQNKLGRIQAMVVTKETKENAKKINSWRKRYRLRQLDIVELKMVLAEDRVPISSRRIRIGEINRDGVVYSMRELWGRLPKNMRKELRKPLGRVARIRQLPPNAFLISIGDVSTKRLIEAQIKPELAVFDLKVRRRQVFNKPKEIGISDEYKIVKINNPAGTVSKEAFDFFAKFFKHMHIKLSNSCKDEDKDRRKAEGSRENRVSFKRLVNKKLAVWVEGEEDLATLPAVLLCPLGTIVIYGQPPSNLRRGSRDGLVVVEVTEKKKKEVFNILNRFNRE